MLLNGPPDIGRGIYLLFYRFFDCTFKWKLKNCQKQISITETGQLIDRWLKNISDETEVVPSLE